MPKLYDEETIRQALTQLALCAGDSEEAARRLKDLGTPLPARTLRRWRDTHAQRLDEIRAEVVPHIHRRLARNNEDLADRYARLEAQMADQLEAELPSIPAKDLPSAVKNIAVSKGIASEKALLMRGQPTSIIETRDSHEIFRMLEGKMGFIDGHAEDVTSPASGRDGPEQKPAAPPALPA